MTCNRGSALTLVLLNPLGSAFIITLVLLNPLGSAFANSEANWSGSALFAIKYRNLYQLSGSSNLIGLKLEMGVAS